MNKFFYLTAMLVFFTSCIDNPTTLCGNGQLETFNDERACVYHGAIIETGFECPPDFGVQSDLDGFPVCSPEDLSAGFREELVNRYDVELIDDCLTVPCAAGEVCEDGTCVPTCVPEATETCNDNVDNTCDGLVDCEDPSCSDAPVCVAMCMLTEVERQSICDRSTPTSGCFEQTAILWDCDMDNCDCELGCDVSSESFDCMSMGAECVFNCEDVDEMIGFEKIAAGDRITFGLTQTGNVFSWGQGGPTRPQQLPAVDGFFSDIIAGPNSFCTRAIDGHFRCSGDNAFGQFGVDPAMFPQLSQFVIDQFASEDIFIGPSNACFSGAVTFQCLGRNDFGQLGRGTVSPLESSYQFDGVGTSVLKSGSVVGLRPNEVAFGDRHVCAIESTAVWCWGANDVSQLGNSGVTTQSTEAVQVFEDVARTKPLVAERIWTHANRTCVKATIGGDNGVFCWGEDATFALPGDAIVVTTSPTWIFGDWDDGESTATLISEFVGPNGYCLVESIDGARRTVCYGNRGFVTAEGVQLWGGLNDASRLETVDGELKRVKYGRIIQGFDSSPGTIAIGENHMCWLRDDTRIACWGEGASLGRTPQERSEYPILLLNP